MPHNQWVINLKEALEAGRLDVDDGEFMRMPPMICRVPADVREMNEKAYQPKVVSIGPYHHGEERLQAMEKHKRRALLHFLRRSKQTPEDCLDLLNENLPEIMAAYDNLDKKWKDDKELFLELMLTDGCFILEIVFTSQGMAEEYAEDDPIFGRHGRFFNVPSIRRDLLLIENQIPLLVLQKLFVFSGVKIKGCESSDCLIKLLLELLPEYVGSVVHGQLLKQSLHILDMYRRRLMFGDKDIGELGREERSDDNMKKLRVFIPSAMALHDHGISFSKERPPEVRFSRRRLLYWQLLSADFRWRLLALPEQFVDDTTESVFLNTMVFESLYPAADARFTSYVYLLSELIVSPKDANLLSTELGIIRNGLGSDEALVDLFRRISSANFLPDHRLFELQETINEYCGRRRNRFRAYFNRTYFRNPWARLSVFSAVVLFVLTAVQTLYAIYPNYTNKHNPL